MKKIIPRYGTLIVVVFLLVAGIAVARTPVILVRPFQSIGDKTFSGTAAGISAAAMSDLKSLSGIRAIPEGVRRMALAFSTGATGICGCNGFQHKFKSAG